MRTTTLSHPPYKICRLSAIVPQSLWDIARLDDLENTLRGQRQKVRAVIFSDHGQELIYYIVLPIQQRHPTEAQLDDAFSRAVELTVDEGHHLAREEGQPWSQ
jgi:hypothetical protein